MYNRHFTCRVFTKNFLTKYGFISNQHPTIISTKYCVSYCLEHIILMHRNSCIFSLFKPSRHSTSQKLVLYFLCHATLFSYVVAHFVLRFTITYQRLRLFVFVTCFFYFNYVLFLWKQYNIRHFIYHLQRLATLCAIFKFILTFYQLKKEASASFLYTLFRG